MEKFKFEAERGARLMRYFDSVTLRNRGDLWWNTTMRLWEPLNSHKDCGYSTHAPCRTFRAFKRMLRKHPHIIGEAILVSRYEGYDVESVS